MDIVISGGNEFHQLARRLKKAGEKELSQSLAKAIREQAKPIVDAQKAAVKALPAKGAKHTGLRTRVAGKVRIQVKTTGSDAGVRIQVDKTGVLGTMPAYLNIGSWRHPYFGNKKFWFKQEVPPGWFDRPVKQSGPEVRKGVLSAMEDVAEKIAHGGV